MKIQIEKYTRRGPWAAFTLLLACAPAEESGVPEGVHDNRVQLPPEDDDHFMFVGGEVIIEPGEDKMYCFHMEVEEDMALSDVEMLQGQFGHHSVMLGTSAPLPPGTMEDCSSEDASERFSAFLIPTPGTPEGAAFFVEAGTPVVLQSHYVNASDQPILVRDAVRTRRLPIDEVTTWMASFATAGIGFDLPGDGSESFMSFDCELDRDVSLFYVGGHMHEQGTKFRVEVGPNTEELETIYDVGAWIPEFRDAPPIEIYSGDPLPLPKGTIIRTSCTWENRTGTDLGFPEEMCVGFGVLAGSKELYDCRREM